MMTKINNVKFFQHRIIRTSCTYENKTTRKFNTQKILRVKISCISTARLSPALNGSSEIRSLECSDAIEIHNGIIFDFYTGLPHNIIVAFDQASTFSLVRKSAQMMCVSNPLQTVWVDQSIHLTCYTGSDVFQL